MKDANDRDRQAVKNLLAEIEKKLQEKTGFRPYTPGVVLKGNNLYPLDLYGADVAMTEKQPTIELKYTERGFVRGDFTDKNGLKCSIQESSRGDVVALWLGVDDPEPMVMNSNAARLGLVPQDNCGWMPYYIPKEVLLKTRMELTREQAAELLPLLQHFVYTGELPTPAEPEGEAK